MPNTRKLMLQKFGISEARYIELLGFCRQYFEKKKALEEIYALSSVRTDAEVTGGGAPGKPTETKALKALKYRQDIEKIETSLDFACSGEGKWMRDALINSIIKGYKFYELELYCKPKVFYKARVRFFRKLDEIY